VVDGQYVQRCSAGLGEAWNGSVAPIVWGIGVFVNPAVRTRSPPVVFQQTSSLRRLLHRCSGALFRMPGLSGGQRTIYSTHWTRLLGPLEAVYPLQVMYWFKRRQDDAVAVDLHGRSSLGAALRCNAHGPGPVKIIVTLMG
jgi:hypothetical protein